MARSTVASILLLSDIHANLAALEAVLADAERVGTVDEVWSLGDALGYGPRPNECLDRLRSIGAVAIAGNHELAAVGSISSRDFNLYARAAIEWTGQVLKDEGRDYIETMPVQEIRGDFTLVHGSPRDPVWEYTTGHSVAAANLDLLETPHCVNGHTHVPVAINVSSDARTEIHPLHNQVVDLTEGRWFLNPGSVGQPRDGDPRASYALLNTEAERIRFLRVEYPVAETQHQMQEIGLPRLLIDRLAVGM